MATGRTLNLALVGGGMFGGDVVLRTIEDLERCGLAPYLGRVGLDERARAVAPVELRLRAIGTRTRASAVRLAEEYRARLPGSAPEPFAGETPWNEILERHPIDLFFIATPDHLHGQPVLAALRKGAHVLVEKPLVLTIAEAEEIEREAVRRGLIVGVDLHKRYDPCHRFIFRELVPQIGKPLYARAVLEEPLEVATTTFKWAEASNPFSYVGVHWADLLGHGLGVLPSSLHAVGQKELLRNWSREGGTKDIRTFDALQVAVDYTSGLRAYYVSSWINPREFEGPVNQELEIVGTRGKIEFDQQYRGLRATISGVGSRTFNPHFTRKVERPDTPRGTAGLDGYGKDSIVIAVERAVEVILGMATREALAGTYPDVESSRPTIAVIEAAARVAELNWQSLSAGRGAPVTARFSAAGVEILEPGREPAWLHTGKPW